MAKQEVKQVRTIKSREELIEDIINAGKSIINNADSILGNEKYFLNCKVTFTIDRNINNIVIFQNNREKAIVCITSGELFKKIKDGGKKYKISNTSISNACLGKQKYGGKLPDGTKLQWIYYSDFLKLPIEEQNEILSRNKGSSNDGSFLNCTER